MNFHPNDDHIVMNTIFSTIRLKHSNVVEKKLFMLQIEIHVGANEIK
jgi:hypothetical protein